MLQYRDKVSGRIQYAKPEKDLRLQFGDLRDELRDVINQTAGTWVDPADFVGGLTTAAGEGQYGMAQKEGKVYRFQGGAWVFLYDAPLFIGDTLVSRRTDRFTATAGQQTFNLTRPYVIGQGRLDVFISGVRQRAGVDFTETSTTSFRMLEGVDAGLSVEAVYFSSSQALAEDLAVETAAAIDATQEAQSAAAAIRAVLPGRKTDQFVATSGQRDFTLSQAYVVGQGRLDVYVSGVHQRPGTDFTETSPTTFRMSVGVAAGLDVVASYFTTAQALAADLIEEVEAAAQATAAANAAATGANAARFNWKVPVARFSDIATTYPNPQPYDAVMVTGLDQPDAGYVYRYESGQWRHRQTVTVGPYEQLERIAMRGEKIIDVSHYGAVGDGVTDDSEALRAAAAAMPPTGGTLFFPPGVYLHGDGIPDPVNGTGNSWLPTPGAPKTPLINTTTSPIDIGRDIRLQFENIDNLTILGYGATILSHPDNGECRNNSIFTFRNCNKLRVWGITVDGNKQNRAPNFVDAGGTNQRGNFQVTATRDVHFKDVTSRGSLMDGFYLAGLDGAETLKGLRVDNCVADDAYRNGLTVSNALMAIIDGGRYINTGTTYGTLPMEGIDFEADWPGTTNESGTIRNAYFTGNVTSGIGVSFRTHNLTIEGCTFDNERRSIYYLGVADEISNTTVKGCTFLNCALGEFIQDATYLDNTVKFTPTAAAGDGESGIYFLYMYGALNANDYVIFKRNKFIVDTTNVSTDASYLNLGRFAFNRDQYEFTDNTIVNMMNVYDFGSHSFNYVDGDATPETILVKDNKFILADQRFVGLVGSSTFEPPKPGAMNRVANNVLDGYPKSVKLAFEENRSNVANIGQTYKRSQLLDYQQVYVIDPAAIAYQAAFVSHHITLHFAHYNDSVKLEIVMDPDEFTYKLRAFDSNNATNTVPSWLSLWTKDDKLLIKANGYFVAFSYESLTAGGNGEGTQRITKDADILAKGVEADTTGATALQYDMHVLSTAATTDGASLRKTVGQAVRFTNLNQVGWWNGTGWVDAKGATLGGSGGSSGQSYRKSQLLGYQTVHIIDPSLIAYQSLYISHHITLEFMYYNDKIRLEVVMDPDEFTYTMRYFDSHLPVSSVPSWLTVYTKDDKILVKTNGYFVALSYDSVTTGGNGTGTQQIYPDREVVTDGTDADLTGATSLQFDFHAPAIASTAVGVSLRKRTGQSTYITGANKAAWWNGTGWVDATGTVIP